jgi:hypothetical protein
MCGRPPVKNDKNLNYSELYSQLFVCYLTILFYVSSEAYLLRGI